MAALPASPLHVWYVDIMCQIMVSKQTSSRTFGLKCIFFILEFSLTYYGINWSKKVTSILLHNLGIIDYTQQRFAQAFAKYSIYWSVRIYKLWRVPIGTYGLPTARGVLVIPGKRIDDYRQLVLMVIGLEAEYVNGAQVVECRQVSGVEQDAVCVTGTAKVQQQGFRCRSSRGVVVRDHEPVPIRV